MIEEIKKTKRNHQAVIHAHLKGNVHYQNETPAFDFPLCLLAFTNRCGSNLLAEYLKATDLFCGFQEPLNSDVVAHVCDLNGIASFPDYIEHVTRKQYEDGKSLFMKSSWDQFLMLREWGVLQMFTGLKIIYIERLNYINQAISYVIANQTKQWTVFHKKQNDHVEYDFKTIDSVISANAKANRIFRYLFELLDLDYVHVTYEDLIADPVAHTAKVLQHLGHSADLELLSDYEPRLKSQSGELNREFRDRYFRDSKQLGSL